MELITTMFDFCGLFWGKINSLLMFFTILFLLLDFVLKQGRVQNLE